MMMAGVAKGKLKLKKGPRTSFTKVETNTKALTDSLRVVHHLDAATDLTISQIMGSMGDENLASAKAFVKSSRSNIDKRLIGLADFTGDAIRIDECIRLLTASRERLNNMVAAAITNHCDTIEDVISAFDYEIGRRSGAGGAASASGGVPVSAASVPVPDVSMDEL